VDSIDPGVTHHGASFAPFTFSIKYFVKKLLEVCGTSKKRLNHKSRSR
jgi:hypothetical protein